MGLLILTEHPEGDSGPLLGARKPRLRMVNRPPGLSPTVWGSDPIRLRASTAWALPGPMPPASCVAARLSPPWALLTVLEAAICADLLLTRLPHQLL